MRAMLALAAIAGASLFAGSDLAAQASFVSPVTAAASEGTSGNIFPFAVNASRRYQQVHSDVTMSGVIKSLACRLDGSTGTYAGTTATDMEMFMGYSRTYDLMSTTFDDNYLASSKTQVLKRKIVNLGPQGTNTIPGVYTGMVILFDAPFPYAATRSLIWEAAVYSNLITGSFRNMDADVSSLTVGSTSTTGTGCIATGRTSPMTQSSSIYDVGGILSYGGGVTNGPSSAPVVLSIGATNPNIVLPGVICGGIYTDLLMFFPVGVTSATGLINSYQGFGINFPNTVGGLQFYAQQHAVDAGLSEFLKVANSNGLSHTVPLPNPSKVVQVSRMQNNTNTTTDPKSSYFTTSSIGYGVVTRFDY